MFHNYNRCNLGGTSKRNGMETQLLFTCMWMSAMAILVSDLWMRGRRCCRIVPWPEEGRKKNKFPKCASECATVAVHCGGTLGHAPVS